MGHPNLFITDRAAGSMIVRNKRGKLLLVARKGTPEGWLYMQPAMSAPEWRSEEQMRGIIEGLNISEADPSGGGISQTREFIEFMVGSK